MVIKCPQGGFNFSDEFIYLSLNSNNSIKVDFISVNFGTGINLGLDQFKYLATTFDQKPLPDLEEETFFIDKNATAIKNWNQTCA